MEKKRKDLKLKRTEHMRGVEGEEVLILSSKSNVPSDQVFWVVFWSFGLFLTNGLYSLG